MKIEKWLVLLLLSGVGGVHASAQSPNDSARSVSIAPLTRIPTSAWGADVIVIDSAEIAHSTAQTFSELLQARRPGVSVLQSGGMASDGALVMLRGPTTLIGPSAPVILVDGVRVDSRQFDTSLGGIAQPSRLDDILPEDIERIEILSGAAAALYGDGAASGVILVTTKSGGGGPLRFAGRATWDARQARDEFPANYQRIGISPSTGQPVSDCSLVAVASGQCTPTRLDVWNPLEQASPFRMGNSGRAHVDFGGTTKGTAITLGATGEARRGTLPHDEGSRVGFRGKVTRSLPWGLGIAANGSWFRDDDRFSSGIIGSGLSGSAQDDANRGYRASPADSMNPNQRLRHATGGVQLRWQPFDWLEAAVGTGRDRVIGHGHEDQFLPPPSVPVADFFTYEEHDLTSSGTQLSASYPLRQNIRAATEAGYERDILFTRLVDSTIVNGQDLVGATTWQLRSTAFWINERLVLPYQLAISTAAERITSSMFGDGAGKEWFPSANLSWTPSLRAGSVSNFRLRAAYAVAANPTESLTGIALVLLTNYQPLPRSPKMERTQHMEIGGDATIGGSTTVDLTAFDSRSTHLWVTTGSQAFTGAIQAADMTNKGIEALIAAPIFQRSPIRWTGSLSLAILHNDISHLITPPQLYMRNVVVQGKPYGSLFATTYTYADANHDGIIDTSEVRLGSLSYIGAPLPTRAAAVTTELAFPGRLVLSGTLDYRGGYHILNFTEAVRCGTLHTCRGAQDPSAPLDEQAAAAASRLGGSAVAAWTPGASFMRVREIAVRWTIPAMVTRALGTTADLTVAGRNLATWTNYRGLDPEISLSPPDALPREDAFGVPIPREFILRLDIGGGGAR